MAAGEAVESLTVTVIDRTELSSCDVWRAMFADERKDHRYYEIIEDTLRDGFDYKYFAIRDARGDIRAVQPFFLIDQDILEGIRPERLRWVTAIRRVWPRFFKLRALMVGCSAGEGHLAQASDLTAAAVADVLSRSIVAHAKALGAQLVLLKEFPVHYRNALGCFEKTGFGRVPSMPMTKLNIDYENFDAYAAREMSRNSRSQLRRKLRVTRDEKIEMSVTDDVTGQLDEIYPLYLQVYERSNLRFEKLTKDYFRLLSERMKDKVRFQLWHRGNKLVAFSMGLVQGDVFVSEYVGFDYAIALDLHLYHHVARDMISWGIARGYKWISSSGLNYDPKLRLGHRLDPVDLYVRHVSPLANTVFKRVLPWLSPVRYDATLKKFPNYREMW